MKHKKALAVKEFGAAVVLLVPAVFFSWDVCQLSVPKMFLCMNAVRKYLTFGDLKKYLKEEQFSQFIFPESSEKVEFYYSDKWLFVNGIYIPRKLILDMVEHDKSLYSPYSQLIIITKDGKRTCLAQIKKEEEQEIEAVFRNSFPEFRFDLENLKRSRDVRFYKELRHDFCFRVSTKEEFLKESGL